MIGFDPLTGTLERDRPADINCGKFAFDALTGAIRWALGIAEFSPLSLFASGEQGAWYDPSDFIPNWRLNLLTYTEEFDNSVWVKTDATISANAATAPDGTLTADSIIENTVNTFHRISQSISTISGLIKLSFYIKAITSGRYLQLGGLGIGGASENVNFNPDNGTVTLPSTSVVMKSATITSAGNGWYRCEAIINSPTATAVYLGLSNDLDNRTAAIYTGDGTSGIYIWGADLRLASLADTEPTYQPIITPEISYLTYQPQPVLFQDSAGTTPVTAVEQPVGLMLDKSKGLALGPELVTGNTSNFATGVGGWVVFGPSSTITATGGELQVAVTIADGGNGAKLLLSGLTAGVTYRLSIKIRSVSAVSPQNGGVRWANGNVSTGYTFLVGNTDLSGVFTTKTGYFTPTGTSVSLFLLPAGYGSCTFAFDDVQVTSIAGNHAYQPTSAARPILSARYNLLTYTEQFDNAVWNGGALRCTDNTSVAPNGTTTAATFTLDTASTSQYIYQAVTGVSGGVQYKISLYVKAGTHKYVDLILGNDLTTAWVTVCFDLNASVVSKTANGSGGTHVSSSITPDNGGWHFITLTGSLSSAPKYWQLQAVSSNNPTLGNYGYQANWAAPAGSVFYIWGADLRVANDGVGIPSYQRVGAAVTGTSGTVSPPVAGVTGVPDYDTVGFPLYLRFDGVDDLMLFPTITLPDSQSLFVGVSPTTAITAATSMQIIIDTPPGDSVTANAGRFAFGNVTGGLLDERLAWIATTGGTPRGYGYSAADIPAQPHVITATFGNALNSAAIRLNAANVSLDTSTAGPFDDTNSPQRYGQIGRLLAGRIYSLIIRGAESTETQITQTETWVNSKTKAY